MDNTTASKGGENDPFIRVFKALPLDQKFANLFKMEAVALTEAVSMLINDPMKIVGKVGDAITDIGSRIGNEVKKATSGPDTEPEPTAGPTKRSRKKGQQQDQS